METETKLYDQLKEKIANGEERNVNSITPAELFQLFVLEYETDASIASLFGERDDNAKKRMAYKRKKMGISAYMNRNDLEVLYEKNLISYKEYSNLDFKLFEKRVEEITKMQEKQPMSELAIQMWISKYC